MPPRGIGFSTVKQDGGLSYHALSELDDRQVETLHTAGLSFLHQWKVLRWIRPQGPLQSGIITDRLLQDIKVSPAVIHPTLHAIFKEDHPNSSLDDRFRSPQKRSPVDTVPPPARDVTWTRLRQTTTEDYGLPADKALYFGGQLQLEKDGTLRLTLSPPSIQESRRLYRQYPTHYLLKLILDLDSERQLQNSKRPANDFQKWLESPIFLLGRYYRCFFYKNGALYFYAERLPSFLRPMASYTEFLETLIPRTNHRNDKLALSKYSARLGLWFSKTDEICTVGEVRFVPDITNRTLPISRKAMEKIREQFGLLYLPSCVEGVIRKTKYTWSLQHFEFGTGKSIGVYEDEGMLNRHGDLLVKISIRDGSHSHLNEGFMTFKSRYLQTVPAQHALEEEQIMSDGNGFMSYALARQIADKLELEAIATGVQGRIGGAKGFWNIEPNTDIHDPVVWIEIRESQHKYIKSQHSEWVFESIAVSSAPGSTYLGEQMLRVLTTSQTNLFHQRAINERLNELFEEGGDDGPLSLLEIEDPRALRRVIEVREKVHQQRNTGESKMGPRWMYDQRERDDMASSLAQYDEPEIHPMSGQSRSWGEQCISMLDAGITTNDVVLRSLLNQMAARGVQDTIGQKRVPVPESKHLYVICDPLGVLREDEVFCQLSGDNLVDAETKMKKRSAITGNVLVSRNPCILPTDVQRVRAVYKPELETFYDVIVCSTKGKQSLLSKLSGGDYDGDSCHIIFDTRLADNWVNATDSIMIPPFEESEYFEEQQFSACGRDSIKDVADLNAALDDAEGTANVALELQKILLAPLFLDSKYGILAKAHVNSLSDRGPYHPATITLGHLYAMALDAAKAGKRFKLTEGQLNAKLGQLDAAVESTRCAEGDSAFLKNIQSGTKSVSDMSGLSDGPDSGSESPSPSPRKTPDIRMHLHPPKPSRLPHRAPTSSGSASVGPRSRRDSLSSSTKSPFASRLAEVALDGGSKNVLEGLQASARSKQTELQAASRKVPLNDPDMGALYSEAVTNASGAQNKAYLLAMKKHVQGVAMMYDKDYKPAKRTKEHATRESKSAVLHSRPNVALASKEELDARNRVIDAFWTFEVERYPGDVETARYLLASCAYSVAQSYGSDYNHFPDLVAHRRLMNIKAIAVDRQQTKCELPPRAICAAIYGVLCSRTRLPAQNSKPSATLQTVRTEAPALGHPTIRSTSAESPTKKASQVYSSEDEADYYSEEDEDWRREVSRIFDSRVATPTSTAPSSQEYK